MHPSEIKIGQYELTVYDLFLKIKANELIIESNKACWDEVRNSKSIESIFLGLTMTPIYVDAAKPEEWIVLDGGKRLNAIYEYISGNFLLNGLEFLEDLENKYFESLSKPLQRKLNESKLTIYSFNQGISPEARLSLIRRIVPDIKNDFSYRMLYRLMEDSLMEIIKNIHFRKQSNQLSILKETLKSDGYDFLKEKLELIDLYYQFHKNTLYSRFNSKMNYAELVVFLNKELNSFVVMVINNYLADSLDIVNNIYNSQHVISNEKIKIFISNYLWYFVVSFGQFIHENGPNQINNLWISNFTSLLDEQQFITRFKRNSRQQRLQQIYKLLENCK